MADAASIIETIMADPKIAGGRNFAGTVYRDQPILFTGPQLAQMTPRKIMAMRRLARGFDSNAKVFRDQGKFMESYEDDFDYPGEFSRYFPTYQQMNDAQLRGYFTWRTKVRRGTIEHTSLSFAFVHIYELLNQIGVRTPEEGFRALRDFWTAYRELDPGIDAYVPLWLKDCAVYHNLDKSLLHGLSDDIVDGSLSVLLDDAPRDAGAAFAALAAISSYELEKSRFFALHSDDVKAVAHRVFAAVTSGKNAGEKFFGKLCAHRYTMFKSAVFYHPCAHADAVYELSRHHKYLCKNGLWHCERFLRYGDNNKRFGALLKTVDFFMRRHYGFGSTLRPGNTDKALTARVEKEILKFLADKRAATPPAIDIDLSKLQGIRAASLATRDRLLVEETGFGAPLAAAETRGPAGPAEAAGLNADERHFLACLLHGRPCAEFLRRRGLMQSVLVDGINEKLFDRFGDTVIVDAGESPVVLEDYAEELKAEFASGEHQ